MRIEEERNGEVLILRLAGRLDSATAGGVEVRLLAALDAAPAPARLVVDCEVIEGMTSAGMRPLLSAVRRAKQSSGRILLAAPPPSVRATLEAGGFTPLFEIHPTVEAALAALA